MKFFFPTMDSPTIICLNAKISYIYCTSKIQGGTTDENYLNHCTYLGFFGSSHTQDWNWGGQQKTCRSKIHRMPENIHQIFDIRAVHQIKSIGQAITQRQKIVDFFMGFPQRKAHFIFEKISKELNYKWYVFALFRPTFGCMRSLHGA